MAEQEAIALAGKRLLCRNAHLTYENLLLAAAGPLSPFEPVDTEHCEFGNDEEHRAFFAGVSDL